MKRQLSAFFSRKLGIFFLIPQTFIYEKILRRRSRLEWRFAMEKTALRLAGNETCCYLKLGQGKKMSNDKRGLEIKELPLK